MLGLLGWLAASARNLPQQLWWLTRRLFLSWVEVYSSDDLYEQTLTYLYETGLVAHTRDLAASTFKQGDERRIIFSPAVGTHRFRFEGRWMWLFRYREKIAAPGGGMSLVEHFVIQAFGRDKGSVERLIKEAYNWAEKRDAAQLVIYGDDGYGNLVRRARKRKRRLDSVILRDGLKEGVVNDLTRFKADEVFYLETGIPYVRTYLFHGSGGTGKTSLVQAIASHFNSSIVEVSLSGAKMDDDRLMNLLRVAPKDAVVLIEDVDAVFSRESSLRSNANAVTLSGLTNALDGVSTPDGRVVVLTSNHPNGLADVLVREGRVDVKIEFELADHSQAYRLCEKFFPGNPELASAFADLAGERALSPAALQDILLRHRDDPVGLLLAA